MHTLQQLTLHKTFKQAKRNIHTYIHIYIVFTAQFFKILYKLLLMEYVILIPPIEINPYSIITTSY